MATANSIDSEKKFDLGIYLRAYLHYWWLFAISVAAFVACGALFIHVKSPQYTIHASVALNDNDDDKSGSMGGSFGGLLSSFSIGGLGHKAAEDEAYKISSHSNMAEAVRRLGLHTTYRRKDWLLDQSVWYFQDEPIKVEVPIQVLDTISKGTSLKFHIAKGGKKITVSGKQGDDKLETRTYTSFPFQVKTPLATFRVDKTEYFNPIEDMTIRVAVNNPDIVAEALDEDFSAGQFTKKSNIIELLRYDVNIPRGKALLSALIDIYNENSVNQRQDFAAKTIDFLDHRLMQLYTDLEQSENDIESYKRANKLTDPEIEAQYIMKKRGTVEEDLISLETKAGVTQMVLEFLRNSDNKYALVPFTSSLTSEPITAYNELVLERMRLVNGNQYNSAQIKTLNSQIDAMRSNLLSSLDRELSSTNLALANLMRENNTDLGRISDLPEMEKELTALYRDQKIKNSIYGFLLQKREENELKRMRTTAPGVVINQPYAEEKPRSPKKFVVIGVTFLIGLVVPVLLINSGLMNGRWFRRRKKAGDEPDTEAAED